MKNSFYVTVVITLLAIVVSYFQFKHLVRIEDDLRLKPAEFYPRWLSNDDYKTSQTSGITLISEQNGEMEFLLADDIGKIHRLNIKSDTLFDFSEIKFSDEVNKLLAGYPKLDFEEIFFDRYTGDVYLSIEGNGNDHLQYHSIYRLRFKEDDIARDTIIAFEKINFKPEQVFYDKLLPNIGYESITADENYFYLGLENSQTAEGEYSNHTVIRIADKKSLTIVKEISTDSLDIVTICGLYSDENYSLWGIDRNQKKVFKLLLDGYFNIVDLDFYELKTVIPGFNQFEYVGSLESITITSGKFLFLVDDPWHTYFIPPDEILKNLDDRTINNFKSFVPIIYKFKLE